MKLKYLIYISGIYLLACGELISPDVEALVLTLNSPADSLITAQESLPFWWEADTDAEAYRIQLANPDFDNPLRIVDTLITGTRLDLLLAEGVWQWRIRVENESSSSAWQLRSFRLDRTVPVSPQAIYPQSQSVLSEGSDPLELRWLSADPPIGGRQSPVTDSVYLYQIVLGQANLLAAQALTSEAGIQNSWDISADLPAAIPGDSLGFQWEVRSQDIAGNIGPFSISFFSLTE